MSGWQTDRGQLQSSVLQLKAPTEISKKKQQKKSSHKLRQTEMSVQFRRKPVRVFFSYSFSPRPGFCHRFGDKSGALSMKFKRGAGPKWLSCSSKPFTDFCPVRNVEINSTESFIGGGSLRVSSKKSKMCGGFGLLIWDFFWFMY